MSGERGGKRLVAEKFGEVLPTLIIAAGALHSTAYKCAELWWLAVERDEFGPPVQP